MKLEDRIAKHRRMAESYRDKYVLQKVQDGEAYDEWVFTDDAVYTSPYFVAEQELVLKDVATHWDTAATVEAKAYGITFPDWKPVGHKFWPAENGFVMRYRWEGDQRQRRQGHGLLLNQLRRDQRGSRDRALVDLRQRRGVRPVPGGGHRGRGGVHSTEMSTCRLWQSTSRSTDSVSEDTTMTTAPPASSARQHLLVVNQQTSG